MLAYDYPILGLFWTMLILFLWFAWIMLVFRVIMDVFRNDEMGGVAKALWLLFVIIVPWFGVLIYLIVNGGDMNRRADEDAQASEAAAQAYIRQVAGASGGTADQLSKLADLHSAGQLSDAEYDQAKARVVAG